MRRAALILALAALCGPALAQRSRAQPAPAPAPSAPAPAAPGAPAPATPNATEPERTTATFGEWTLRCVRPEKAPPTCQVDQTLADAGKTVAQTLINRPRPGDGWRLTFAVQANVTLTTQPRLAGAENEAGFPPIELTWRRCVNVCIADAPLGDEQLKRLRGRTENARIMLQDGAGRDVALPFGPRGLGQALDALAKGS